MFDFSKCGIKEGIEKALIVICYVAVSGAITALINYFKPLEGNEYGLVYMVINAGLAGIQKWITTKTK